MVQENKDNHILKCRRLFHQYAVDMYVKVESELLTFIRLNQTKLRSEEYIHLRDAINADRNAHKVDWTIILLATYDGGKGTREQDLPVAGERTGKLPKTRRDKLWTAWKPLEIYYGVASMP